MSVHCHFVKKAFNHLQSISVNKEKKSSQFIFLQELSEVHHENIVALLDCQVKPFSPSFLFCLPTRFKDVPGVFHDTMGVARDQPRSTTLFARVSFLFNFKGIFQNPHPPPQAYCNMGASCFVGDNIHLGKKRDSPYPHGVLSIRNIWKKSRFKIKRELGVCCKHDQMRMPRIAFPLVGGARHLIRELTSLGNENVHMPQRIPTKCWRENLPLGIWPAIFFHNMTNTTGPHCAVLLLFGFLRLTSKRRFS